MNTKINLTYKDVPYTLEYDRMSIKTLEANGFSVEEFMKKPMSSIELAFAGAFLKNHKKTNQKVIDEIYAGCPNKNSLLEALVQMIQETYEAFYRNHYIIVHNFYGLVILFPVDDCNVYYLHLKFLMKISIVVQGQKVDYPK